MSSIYPNAIDGYSQIRIVRDLIDEVIASDTNGLRSAVIAIEQTLGVNPQGAFGTVVARLNDAYSNLASHVLGNLPRHTDNVIETDVKTSGLFTLAVGTVASQLSTLLGYVNSTSVFTGLSDTPSSYSGQGGKNVRVNSGASALEFFAPTFLNLDDTPSSFTANKTVRVNSGATELEFSDDTFLRLIDSPSSYSGQGGKSVRVNPGATALEFSNPSFLNLTDTPINYSGQGGYFVKVNLGETGLEFGTTGAVSINFTDLLDTPSSYSGLKNKILSVNAGQTAVEGRVELPTEMFSRILDSFVIEGLDAYQDGSGIDIIISPGRFASNGRIISVPNYIPLTTSVVSGDYYVSIKFNSLTENYEVTGPTTSELDAVGDSVETSVLLKKFTHNGATWTSSVDLRRYGMLLNNKNYFTVGNDINVPDGYGADFTSMKSAIAYIKAMDTSGSTKMAPKKLLLVDDISDNLVSIDIDGFEIDGGGRKVSISSDSSLFSIDAYNVKIHNVHLEYSGLSSPTSSAFAMVGQNTDVSGVDICNNIMSVASGSLPNYFIVCGNSGGTNAVENCNFSNNLAEVGTSGISPLVAFGSLANVITKSIIQGNTFYQTSFALTSGACIRVGQECCVDGNIIYGGYNTGVEFAGANTIISNNIINGGNGTAIMNKGITIRSSALGSSFRSVIDGNIIKGITDTGIDCRQPDGNSAADVIVSNNIIDNRVDVGALSMIGIQGRGTETLIVGNKIYGAGVYGIDRASLCIGNIIQSGQSGMTAAIRNNGNPFCVIDSNQITACSGIGIDVGGGTFCVVSNNTLFSAVSPSHGIYNPGSYSIVSGNFVSGHPYLVYVFSPYVSVIGNYSRSATIHSIYVGATEHIQIVGNYLNSPVSNGIYASAGSSNLLISNNLISSPGIDGIRLEDGDQSLIGGNYISLPVQNGINIVAGGDFVSILNNFIRSAGAIAIKLTSNSDKCLINGNYIYDAVGIGVNVSTSCDSCVVSNNFLYQCNGGVQLDSGADDCIVSGNYVSGDGGTAIYTGGLRGIISNNFVISFNTYGIHFTANDNLISENYIYDTTALKNGIAVAANYSAIIGNHIKNCYIAITAANRTDIIISSNQMINNTFGIDAGSADNMLISSNYIRGTGSGGGGWGLVMGVNGNWWTIVGNYILEFQYGIDMRGDYNMCVGNRSSVTGTTSILLDAAQRSLCVGNIGFNNSGSGISMIGCYACVVSSNYMEASGSGFVNDVSPNQCIIQGNMVLGGSTPSGFGVLTGSYDRAHNYLVT